MVRTCFKLVHITFKNMSEGLSKWCESFQKWCAWLSNSCTRLYRNSQILSKSQVHDFEIHMSVLQLLRVILKAVRNIYWSRARDFENWCLRMWKTDALRAVWLMHMKLLSTIFRSPVHQILKVDSTSLEVVRTICFFQQMKIVIFTCH